MASTAIPLTLGLVALVDAADYEWLCRYRWMAIDRKDGKGFYACRREKDASGTRIVYMHREILGTKPGMDTDHANGNGLDNRRQNLREATPAENGRNCRSREGTSRYKGVCWHEAGGKWMAQIRGAEGTKLYLGSFVREEDAARAYDEAARRLHGGFGRFNFPLPGESDALEVVA